MALLLPEVLHWPNWFAGQQPDSVKREFYEGIIDGRLTVAFEGYEYTYSHAGSPTSIDVTTFNNSLRTAARELLPVFDRDKRESGPDEKQLDALEGRTYVQQTIVDRFPTIFGTDEPDGRGPGAGVLWLDYRYMPDDAPPQVVGHTRQLKPTREGNVVCGNIIRKNQGTVGGEGVIVETPDRIGVVVRKEDSSASCTYFP